MITKIKTTPHLLQSFGRRRCTLVLVLYLTETLCQTCKVYPAGGKNKKKKGGGVLMTVKKKKKESQ